MFNLERPIQYLILDLPVFWVRQIYNTKVSYAGLRDSTPYWIFTTLSLFSFIGSFYYFDSIQFMEPCKFKLCSKLIKSGHNYLYPTCQPRPRELRKPKGELPRNWRFSEKKLEKYIISFRCQNYTMYYLFPYTATPPLCGDYYLAVHNTNISLLLSISL